MTTIVEVDEECNITYDDGHMIICMYRPHFTFIDCDVGYGGHGECAKWNYYHKDD